MITIITVTYNSRLEIEHFLVSLSEMIRRDPREAETRIWDNASSDETGQFLLIAQKNLPELRISVNLSPKNVGLSRAINSEVASSEGELVLLCNPDVEFSDEVSDLLDFALSHPELGVVPDLKNPDGTTQRSVHRRFPTLTRILFEYTSFGRFLSRFLPFIRDDYKYSKRKFIAPTIIEQPGGVFLVLHRKKLEELSREGKLYDERFPVFWNDVDLSMRARVEGLKFVIVPEVWILHGFGHSVKKLDSEMRLTLFFGKLGLMGFADKWKLHPRVIQGVLFLDSILAVSLGFVARLFKLRSRNLDVPNAVHSVFMLRSRIMKFWCSIH